MKRTYLALAAIAVVLSAGPALAASGSQQLPGGMGSAGSGQDDQVTAYQQGMEALDAQEYRQAIRFLRQARRDVPGDGVINYALGVAYRGAGENDDARSALERSVRAPNAPAAAFSELGEVYLALGRRDDAVAQQAALQQKIDNCSGNCSDAQRAEYQAAHAFLTSVLAAPAPAAADPATTGWNFPSVEEGRAAYAEAVGHINQERLADAFASLQRAEMAVGPHPDVLNYMGFVSRKMGRFDDAIAYYNGALAIDPNHLGATEYLGELYIQLGQVERAERQLARLDELCAYGCEQREELARWIESAGR